MTLIKTVCRRCLPLGLLFCVSGSAEGAEVTLAWDPSIGPNIAGYRVLYGFEARRYLYAKDVGNVTTAKIELPEGGTEYHFAVIAYNSMKVPSPPSEEVVYVPPHRPRLRLSADTNHIRLAWNSSPGKGYRVLYKPDLSTPGWSPISKVLVAETPSMEWTAPFNPVAPSAFFKLEVFQDPLAAPTLQMSPLDESTVALEWNAVPGMSYCVLYKAPGATDWTLVSPLLTASQAHMQWITFVDPLEPLGEYSIHVIPDPDAPPVLNISRSNGMLTLSWSAVPGRAYRVLQKGDLASTEWGLASDILVADSLTLEWTTPVDGSSEARYFIVQAGRLLNPEPSTSLKPVLRGQ
ncbi:MAG TPA: fibronectin type III domain-containing protein [Verrucomicrobiota bacterium]|nr:fibronectin type III domain-containing protein [Verrucomicrobiota bacterium]